MKRLASLVLPLLLSGCSYAYDILAVVINGELAFIVDPKSSQQPNCINQIEVASDEQQKTFWEERVSYECKNSFPVTYGHSLKGGPVEAGAETVRVKPQTLMRGVVYHVLTTTGATGYGGGLFVLDKNGRVRNLPRDYGAGNSSASNGK